MHALHAGNPVHKPEPSTQPRRHKYKIIAQLSPLSRFCKRFARAVAYTWADFFWMHETENADGVLPDELNTELAWAQNRPGSMWHGRQALKATDGLEVVAKTRVCEQQDGGQDDAPLDLCAEVQFGGPFVRALTKVELDNMLEYRWRWPEEAWQLNQVAEVHAQHSNPQYLHALIRNCGLIFSQRPPTPRWLSATELSLACSVSSNSVNQQRVKCFHLSHQFRVERVRIPLECPRPD